MYYKPDSEYYLVTKALRSPSFRVNMTLSKNMRTILKGKEEQAVIQGQFRIEYAKGTFDEVTLTYVGEKPLVFAVHLETIDFVKDNGKIINLEPLSLALKLLGAEDDKVWEF